MTWDVFIAHAAEDKADCATPLAEALRSRGLSVCYDDFVLSVGDSLTEFMNRGIAESRFGIVILSERFFAKRWPQAELAALLHRERDGRSILLPLWKGLEVEGVLKHAPLLADRRAARWEDGLERVVGQLAAAIGYPPGARSPGGRPPLLTLDDLPGFHVLGYTNEFEDNGNCGLVPFQSRARSETDVIASSTPWFESRSLELRVSVAVADYQMQTIPRRELLADGIDRIGCWFEVFRRSRQQAGEDAEIVEEPGDASVELRHRIRDVRVLGRMDFSSRIVTAQSGSRYVLVRDRSPVSHFDWSSVDEITRIALERAFEGHVGSP